MALRLIGTYLDNFYAYSSLAIFSIYKGLFTIFLTEMEVDFGGIMGKANEVMGGSKKCNVCSGVIANRNSLN
jgi:hypothetical protein